MWIAAATVKLEPPRNATSPFGERDGMAQNQTERTPGPVFFVPAGFIGREEVSHHKAQPKIGGQSPARADIAKDLLDGS